MSNISWMNENEKSEYLLRDKAEWEANQAWMAAWLDGKFGEEIRRLQAVEYAGDLPAHDWEMVEEEDEGEMAEVEGFIMA